MGLVVVVSILYVPLSLRKPRKSARLLQARVQHYISAQLQRLAKFSRRSDKTLGGSRPQRHPGYNLDPEDIFPTFLQAESGDPRRQVQLFDDLLERDGTVRNLFDQRASAVSGKPWEVQAASEDEDDQAAAAVLADAVGRMDGFEEMLAHQLTFLRYGWAADELEWRVVDGSIEPVAAFPVHADQFRLATEWVRPNGASVDELLLVTDEAPLGERLRPWQWVVTEVGGSLPLARRGLMRTATWYIMFRLFTTRDWAVFANRFGIPLVVAEIEEFTDQDARFVAEQIVANIGSDSGAVVSSDVKINMKDGAGVSGGGRAAVHGDLAAYCIAECSRLIYGATLANDNGQSGGASFALGSVHGSVRYENVVADAKLLQTTFLRCISRPFMAFNELPGRAPLLKIHISQELNPGVIVDVAEKAMGMGLSVSRRQLRNRLHLAKPQGPEDELSR